jgi:signal transduction histidine kinase
MVVVSHEGTKAGSSPTVPTVTISAHDLWHISVPWPDPYHRMVGDHSSERLAGSAGLIATLAVGLPVLLDIVFGDGTLIGGPLWAWWIAYLVFAAAFLVDTVRDEARRSQLERRALIAVEVGAACATYLVDPEYGFAAVLLVVTAAAGAYSLSREGSAVLVVAQSLVIGAGQLGSGLSIGDAAFFVVVYSSFQAFAVVVVKSEQREGMARTDLAAANVELRATSALLSESSQAAERLRIARELHDVIGHQLTALSLELEVASHHVDGDGLPHVMRARDTAKSLLGDVRTAVSELRSPGARLTSTLRALVEDLPTLEVTMRILEETDVDDERALVIVRCVQEIVTNTLRHAHADRLWITVRTTPEELTVEGRDDGRGAISISPGNGLVGMRERVEGLDGQLVIDSAPGQGFQVTARIPTA